MNFWKSRTAAAAALTTAALTFAAVPAYATSATAPALRVYKTLSSSFVGPLQFAVAGSRVVVADSFTSTLSAIGSPTPIAHGGDPANEGDLAGVAIDRNHKSLAYTTTNDASHSVTTLTIVKDGKAPVVADLSGFEKTHNPDQVTTYGTDSTDPCVIDALNSVPPPDGPIPVSYPGAVDSHPYAVTSIGEGSWAVADAGGNDIVKVDKHGNVSLIAVLPAQPVKITAAFAASSGLPACVVGITYKFEPVPTDVEVGPNGDLYVSTLPGGPEGPDSGNPGSVYRIDSAGRTTQVATGFASASNLAVDSHGNIFVAQLGSGTIAEVVHGQPQVVLSLPGVVAVEFANGHLFASTAPAIFGLSGPGTVVELASSTS